MTWRSLTGGIVTHNKRVGRGETANVSKNCLDSRNDSEGQIVFHRCRIDRTIHIRMCQNRFDLGSEQQFFFVTADVGRLLSHVIAGQRQPTLVRKRKGKHPSQVSDQITSVFFKQMD